jgi:hypothetical protein
MFDHTIRGKLSDTDRQVDVWLEGGIGAGRSITVAVECRHYDKNPVPFKDLDAFCGFLLDVGANKGVMFSDSGSTEGAKKRAAGAAAKIELEVMTLSETEDFDWDEFLMTGVRSRNASERSTGTSRTEGAKLVIAVPAEPSIFAAGNVELSIGITRVASRDALAAP